MAIPFAKLTILVGAGVAGSILATEGWLSDVPHFIYGAFKFFGKHIQEDKSRSSSAKNTVGDYYLMSQVNSLREQLRYLQSSRPVSIISESRHGYGISTIKIVIIIGTVGSFLSWWKGYKISDMAFVTKGAFNVDRNRIASQIDSVSSSVSITRRHLSSKIDLVECTLNDCLELTVGTKDEVSELCGNVNGLGEKYESVRHSIQALKSKAVEIGLSQDFATKGIYHLCQSAKKLEDKMAELTQFLPSSLQRLTIEQKTIEPVGRTGSLPPTTSASASISEPGTPSTPVETPRVLLSSKTATASNFKDFHGLHTITRSVSMKQNETPQLQEVPNSTGTSSSNETQFPWKLPSLKILTRSRSSASSQD